MKDVLAAKGLVELSRSQESFLTLLLFLLTPNDVLILCFGLGVLQVTGIDECCIKLFHLILEEAHIPFLHQTSDCILYVLWIECKRVE